eukprot:sb/3477341/
MGVSFLPPRSLHALVDQESCIYKQPIRIRYLGHVTAYQPIRDQYYTDSKIQYSSLPALLITMMLMFTPYPWRSRAMFPRYLACNDIKMNFPGQTYQPLSLVLSNSKTIS